MKALRVSAALMALRGRPLWRLLAAEKAPPVMGLLQSLLLDQEKTLSSSVFHERLARELEVLRAHGHDLPQTPQVYVATWIREGWLSRRFPAGASEEEFELTAEAASALRFLNGLLKPRTTATESRLANVIQQLTRLAEETDANPETRMATLVAERERIDAELRSLERDGVKTLPDERALERIREIIALAEDLAADFRNVRDEFDKLNRGLRQSLMESGGSRGEVLEALFAGVDLIAQSEHGKTFTAFWRLLTDGEQSATLMESLEAVTSRAFSRRLELKERRFLQNLTATLMAEGGTVHEVVQQFARSLKIFVQSREFQEQRRLHSLLKEAQQAALQVRDQIRPNAALNYSLTLTSSRIRSVSQWELHDPSLNVADASMLDAEASELGLDVVEELVRQSEIDFRTLRQHLREALTEVSQITVGQLLVRFPAEQGFGSVVGYVALGAKHGELTTETEMVSWVGNDGKQRKAKVPAIYFVRESLLELFDE
ncbi:DUF3375 domain-containing protein [Chromobacterium haemolyticum]|uniref:DUF3375 domain-containing protein n=1 Tax=Chromobacterium haemolyticum TaxID=394935 RepID=UPI0005B89FE1|nr:DUF3375 domain-containing protein [Chromobacterium haemolyticum]